MPSSMPRITRQGLPAAIPVSMYAESSGRMSMAEEDTVNLKHSACGVIGKCREKRPRFKAEVRQMVPRILKERLAFVQRHKRQLYVHAGSSRQSALRAL